MSLEEVILFFSGQYFWIAPMVHDMVFKVIQNGLIKG